MTWWLLALVMWIAVSLALASVPVALRRAMPARAHDNGERAMGSTGVDRRSGGDRRRGGDRRSRPEGQGTRTVERRGGAPDRRSGRDRRRAIAPM
jgi:hypothetical protein